ncbi:hypothetical protein BDP55DRAFT_638416 [Colletotrichum godetiae]|uniref:Uncharacterized protein n=1 Tax=Colletotrichum godetiae TaxID=1209918 RepID=A0AAJ0A847_9PEZI|nr:uncharacterized protein BDP55DRAFT_638416 [Colletotrichum godetiae]KAK1657794.1 hypothetical protein BDP55DRAFT_638416 [Colletotrichum godetiae]
MTRSSTSNSTGLRRMRPSSTGSTSASTKLATTATDLTPPSSSRTLVPADQSGEQDYGALGARSSYEGDEVVGERGTVQGTNGAGGYDHGHGHGHAGYAKMPPMGVGGDDKDKWTALREAPARAAGIACPRGEGAVLLVVFVGLTGDRSFESFLRFGKVSLHLKAGYVVDL